MYFTLSIVIGDISGGSRFDLGEGRELCRRGGGVGRKSLNSFKVNYINYYRPLMQNGIHLMFRTGFLRYKLVLLTVQVSGFNCTVAFVNYAFA